MRKVKRRRKWREKAIRDREREALSREEERERERKNGYNKIKIKRGWGFSVLGEKIKTGSLSTKNTEIISLLILV